VSRLRDDLHRLFDRHFTDLPTPTSELRAGTFEPWDSIAHINLVLAIEQEFRVSFTPQEAASVDSFEAMVSFLEDRAAL